ncbi:MAG TPA: hypothetical protein VNJ70_17845 [Thermoanaerobaculia bacterium]|nr:hypothetical protein [Thermoanaerobaculia bacterium]
MPPEPFPSLPPCVAGAIADALLLRLQGDLVLQAVIVGSGGEIRAAELAALLEIETLVSPTLAVCIRGREPGPQESGGREVQITAIDLVLLTKPFSQNAETGDWLRARLEAQIERVIFALPGGELYNAENVCIAEAVTRVRAIAFEGRRYPSGLIPTVITVAFSSDIDKALQEKVE